MTISQIDSQVRQEKLLSMIEEHEQQQELIVCELKQKRNYGERCDCRSPYPKVFEYLEDDIDSPCKTHMVICTDCGGEVLI